MCPQFLHAFGTFTTMILPFPLPDAAFRLRTVFLDPIELAERGLAHRQPDLRLPRGAFVQGRALGGPDLAFQARAREFPRDRIDVFAEPLRRDPDGVLPLDPLVHEKNRRVYRFRVFSALRAGHRPDGVRIPMMLRACRERTVRRSQGTSRSLALMGILALPRSPEPEHGASGHDGLRGVIRLRAADRGPSARVA